MSFEFTDVEKWQMKIRLLENAKLFLASNIALHGYGVCAALNAAWYNMMLGMNKREGWLLNECNDELHNYIAKALGDNAYLSSWIREKIGHAKVGAKIDLEKLRATRIAWIEWMIRCYERKLKKAGAV